MVPQSTICRPTAEQSDCDKAMGGRLARYYPLVLHSCICSTHHALPRIQAAFQQPDSVATTQRIRWSSIPHDATWSLMHNGLLDVVWCASTAVVDVVPRREVPCPSRSIIFWAFVSWYRCDGYLIITRQSKHLSTYQCAIKGSLATQPSQRKESRACGVYELSAKGGVLRGELTYSMLLSRLVSRCIGTHLEQTWAFSGCVTHVSWGPNLRAIARGLARYSRGHKARACCGIPCCLRVFCT